MIRIALAVALLAGVAYAQPVPPALARVALDERVGVQLPLDTWFTETRLGPRTLRSMLDPAQPTILVLAYARCTMLCNLVLRGTLDVVRKLEPVPGTDYKLVMIGLDAEEPLSEAREHHDALLLQLVRGDWAYLLGERAAIDAIANPLGFRYAWDPRTKQYAHPAAIFVLTPEGRVSRYLHGVQFDPGEVESALELAAEGKLITTPAAAVLRCFRFDAGRRPTWVERYLRIGAALTAALSLAAIGGLVGRERRRRQS
jgi:protein SCO1/2